MGRCEEMVRVHEPMRRALPDYLLAPGLPAWQNKFDGGYFIV